MLGVYLFKIDRYVGLLIPDLYLLSISLDFYLFCLSLFCLIYLLSIIKTTKYLFILFPIFLLIPFYVYYISIYHVTINEQILSIVLETDLQEAWNFIGYNVYIYICICILVCVLYICILSKL